MHSGKSQLQKRSHTLINRDDCAVPRKLSGIFSAYMALLALQIYWIWMNLACWIFDLSGITYLDIVGTANHDLNTEYAIILCLRFSAWIPLHWIHTDIVCLLLCMGMALTLAHTDSTRSQRKARHAYSKLNICCKSRPFPKPTLSVVKGAKYGYMQLVVSRIVAEESRTVENISKSCSTTESFAGVWIFSWKAHFSLVGVCTSAGMLCSSTLTAG